MVNYTQKDARVKVGGADLFCDSATIKYDSNIQPNYNILHNKNAFNFVANSPSRGAFSITYYLTGSDPLATNLHSERESVSLEMNGLTVNSGYLTSYGFQCTPFDDLKIKAEFAFYHEVDGTFAASSSEINNVRPLKVSDMTISDGSVISADKITDISYNYKSDITPTHVIGVTGAIGVTSKQKRIDSNFTLYDYDLSLPATGIKESCAYNFKDKNGDIKQSYYVDGQITNKSISAKTNGLVSSSYTMSQAKVAGSGTVELHTSSPTQGGPGTEVTLYGYGLEKANMGYVGVFECKIIEGSYAKVGISDTIKMKIHPEFLSGYSAGLSVATDDGYSSAPAGIEFSGNAGITF